MSSAKRYQPTNQPSRVGLKGILLYLFPLPILLSILLALISGQVGTVLVNSCVFILYMLAATMARHGFNLEAEYKARKIARAPGTPWKTLSASIFGVATGLTAYFSLSHYSLIESVLMGGGAFLGFYLYYGLDPRKDKTGNISFGVTAEEVITALQNAEKKLAVLETARNKIQHMEFRDSLQRIIQKTRDILHTIEEDPKDLQRARKFLNVYLDSAVKVTEGYALTHKRQNDPTLDNDFRNVLNSMETTVLEQEQKLLENNRFDLDVQIQVLETQLKREGVK